MNRTVSTHPHRRLALGVASALLALGLSACSSGGEDTAAASKPGSAAQKGCVEKAESFLHDYDALPTKLPSSLTPLKSPAPSGKTLITINNGNIAGDAVMGEAMIAAAKSVGWTGKTMIFDGSIENLNAKFAQAISEKPTLIMHSGDPASNLTKVLKQATDSGIVTIAAGIPDKPTQNGWQGVVNGLGASRQLGEVNANLVLRHSGCKPTSTLIADLPYDVLKESAKAYTEVIKRECPDCKVIDKELQAADLASPAATTALVSAIQADPSIKYVFGTLGNAVDGLPAALNAAGITGVTIFGAVPSEQSIQGLRDKTMAWWLNQDLVLDGWAVFDTGLRVMETGAPVDGGAVPIGVLTPETVAPSGVQPVAPADYKELYKALWGADK